MRFPAYEAKNPAIDSYLYVKDSDLRKTFDEFMTGKGSSNPRRVDDDDQARQGPGDRQAEDQEATSRPSIKGLEQARDRGREHGRDRREPGQARASRSTSRRCARPARATPTPSRASTASATARTSCTGPTGSRSTRARYGEYYGVQGMSWKYPPILDDPDRVRDVDGRKLMLYYDGSHLRLRRLADRRRPSTGSRTR